MRSFAALIATAVVCLVVIPVAAQQPPAPAFEKKEFTHSAWTKGIFSQSTAPQLTPSWRNSCAAANARIG